MSIQDNALFRIISGVGKYPRIKPSLDTVAATNNDSVFPCFKEFIIKEDQPLCMQQFAMTMGHEVGRQCFTTEMTACKVLKAIGELEMLLRRDVKGLMECDYVHD